MFTAEIKSSMTVDKNNSNGINYCFYYQYFNGILHFLGSISNNIMSISFITGGCIIIRY